MKSNYQALKEKYKIKQLVNNMKTAFNFLTILLFFNLYACKKEVINPKHQYENKETLAPYKTKIEFQEENLICNGKPYDATECKNENIKINTNFSDVYFNINGKTFQYKSKLDIGLGHEFLLFSNKQEKVLVIDYFIENGHLYEFFYSDNLSLKFLGKKELILNEEDNYTQSLKIERINSEIILSDKSSNITKFNIHNGVRLDIIINKNGSEVIQEQNADINQDGIQDKIQVFWNEKNEKYSVIISISDKNSSHKKLFKNEDLLNVPSTNSTGRGLQKIATKNNYITFEDNIWEGNPTQNRYITFVYDKQNEQLYLHKYGVIAMFDDDNSSKDWEKIYSNKDFGQINFENVTKDFLLRIMKYY